MWIKIGKLFLSFIAIFFFVGNVSASQPNVSMSISQNNVLLGDSVILTITVDNMSNPNTPHLPNIDNFDVKFIGSSQESFRSVSITIQGKQVKKETSGGGYNFDFELTPKKVGTFDIPSFPILINGKTFQSRPFRIKVFDQSEEQSEDIFIVVETDKLEAYLGEKITFVFKWYFNKDIDSYRINVPWLDGLKNFLISDPELDNNLHYSEFIVNENQRVYALKTREIYKGREYTVISFKKILIPMAEGNYVLEPSFLKCDVITGYQKNSRRSPFGNFFDDDFDDFFNLGRKKAITKHFSTRSEKKEIFIRKLPQKNRPATFNGAVGEFDFSIDAKPLSLKTGEPLTLTMKVSGSGNIEQLKLPVLPEVDGFKSYEPESKVDVLKRGAQTIKSKIFEKVLIPRKQGDYTIPEVSFTFFNPRLKEYQTIKKGPFKIHVQKQEESEKEEAIIITSNAQNKEQKREIKILKKDIRYIKTNLEPIAGKEIYEKAIVWFIGYMFPLSILAGLFCWQKRREKFQKDSGFARSRKAFKEVKNHLRDAEKAIQDNNARHFYDALIKGLNNYLANKLNCSLASISPKIVSELKKRGLGEKEVEDLSRLYQTIEMALFSSVKFEIKKIREDYKIAKDLIFTIERILR